jgi:hypothetical protein
VFRAQSNGIIGFIAGDGIRTHDVQLGKTPAIPWRKSRKFFSISSLATGLVFRNPSHGIAFFRVDSRYRKRKTVQNGIAHVWGLATNGLFEGKADRSRSLIRVTAEYRLSALPESYLF